MSTARFHWFVAWRYLMARPRRISPAIATVAGLLFIASTAASIIAASVFGTFSMSPFSSPGGYENALIGAVVVGALGAIALLLGLVRFYQNEPGCLSVPCAVSAGLLACAVGAMTATGDEPGISAVTWAWLGLGIPLVVSGVLRFWSRMPGVAGGSLVIAGLLAVGSGAAFAIARGTLAPASGGVTVYPLDHILLPALGLWGAGMVGVALVVVHRSARRRIGRAGAWMTAALLAAGGAWPYLARVLLAHEGQRLSDLDYLLLDTPAAIRYAAELQWAGLGLLGLGLLLLLVRVLMGGGGHAPGRARVGLLLVAVGLTAAGAISALIARFVLTSPDDVMVMALGASSHRQTVLLAAVALVALGERAAMLAMVRYFFTFFTTVSVAGVAIGSMALVMVLSVMSGFESDLREKILGSNAHVLITKEQGSFTEYRDVAARIDEVPGVVAHTPYLVSEVVILANNNYATVIIKGVDPETIGEVTELAQNLEQPDALARLRPLISESEGDAPDGEPPAGPGPGARPDAHDGDAAAHDGPGWDPPPADMDVDIDEPEDFSGGAVPEPSSEPADDWADDLADDLADGMAGALAGEAPAIEDMDMGEGAVASGATLDPPPADMDVDIDEPEDFSGAGPLRPGEPEDFSGVGPLRTGKTGSKRRIPPRVARLPGVLVGKELVKQIHLYVGQEVRIVSPLGEDTPAGPVPRTRFMRVAGTFFTGMYEYDQKFVYVPLETLQAFLDLGDEVTGIEVRVTDPERTGPVLEALRAALPAGYRVQDWQELNRSLFAALKLEKIAMFLVLAIIILVASFSIVNNLVMVVVEKAKEIALLKTLGATDVGIIKIFVAQGFFIGLVGTVIGVSYGLVACVLGQVYGLPLDPEVYYIDQLPIDIEPMAVVIIAISGVLISVVATVYPAFVGARLRPLEGLRYD